MKNFQNLIEHIFTKKNIKIFLSLLIVVGFFVGTSFAQSNGESTMSLTEQVSYLMNIAISILSRGRVILATLAGKFMTNDFVYGTFLHLDSSLWNLWNIMKNLANIALGLILVFVILKNLFKGGLGKESPIQDAKNTVISTLVAGVLIQMSWFLIAVMIDLSTIGTAAVGALPSQFIVADSGFQSNMSKLIANVGSNIEIDLSMTGDIVNIIKTGNINSDDDLNKLLDTIMPSTNSMAGPFVFLGASVFNLYDLTDTSKNLSGTDDWSELFLSLGINSGVLFIFSVSLFLVFIFNLFRVITLWLVIPLSPLIFMMFAFSKVGKSSVKIDKLLGDFANTMSLNNIMKLIFMPVYMTLVLSIVLIVMVLVRSVIKADNGNLDLTEHNNMVVESRKNGDTELYDSSLDIADIAHVNLHFKDSLANILIYFLCMILMIFFVKSCIFTKKGTGIGFIDKQVRSFSSILWGDDKKFGGLLGTTGVLPLGNNGEKIGLGTAWNYVKEAPSRLNDRLTDKATAQDNAIKKALGLNRNNGDFDILNHEVRDDSEKQRWIEDAARIGIRRGYKYEYEFSKDSSFNKAMATANIGLSKNRIASINTGEIYTKMQELKKSDNKESESKQSTTEQTAS